MKSLRNFIVVAFVVSLALAIAACGDSGSPKGDTSVKKDSTIDTGGSRDITVDGLFSGDTTVDQSITFDTLPTPDTRIGDSARADRTIFDSGPTPDLGPRDATVDGINATICSASKVLIQEVAVGQPDYVAIKNYGTAAVDVNGYKLVMTGISVSTPDEYTVTVSTVIPPGGVLYFFENSTGTLSTDINTGANIPFYDGLASSANAVALFDNSGKLTDYWAVIAAVNLPAGAAYPAPNAYPAGFTDAGLHSVQRKATATATKCPNFDFNDWIGAALTR